MNDPLLHPRTSSEREVRESYAADASGLSRVPDAVSRPESEREIVELLAGCSAHGISITPQGLRSSTTGSSVVREGIALSVEKLDRVIEVNVNERFVRVEPGKVLGEMKRELSEMGLFYPPDPTSENECTVGGTVATNASGSRTYRYGATRPYVRALRVVLADGTVEVVRRCRSNKNATGYFGLQDPVDLFVGSEGTLGVVTEITLDLLPAPTGFFGGFAFFPDWKRAIEFVKRADLARREGRLSPRCLELFDDRSLELVSGGASRLRIPEQAGAAIFFEEEVDPNGFEKSMERWSDLIEECGGDADATIIATTSAEQSVLRELRHSIPAGMNELGARAVANGGRKVSTDFAVSLDQIDLALGEGYRIASDLFGGEVIGYGHVGNGHPHFNLLANSPEELVRAQNAARTMTMRALELGGTLTAEHGIGKIKSELFADLYPKWVVDAMRAVKSALDPKGILAPGNLFD